ncbi:MAG: methylmalonyl-CoA mutase [Bdellovibrionales bacterium]|nr:methylmalonyl-CoA mutase [Bdellovibrionales bacterium]
MSKNKERKATFQTASGIELKRFYDQTDWQKDFKENLGEPGSFPYTRGVHETMYRGRLWTMRQYAGFGTAQEANERYLYLLKQGTTGLSVAFDLPTQMGRDSDHSLAKGEVGKVGVAISSLEDMRTLLKGIPLDKISISMTINATAAILLALLLVHAEEEGVAWSDLRGTIQNDILKEYIARGTYIYPPKHALKIVTDVFEFCSKEVPNWNTISISGYHIREAGSTAVQEVAFTLADGIAYVESALKAGLLIDEFAPRLAFFFNCHNDFLEEIAKFRAARRLWAKIMKDRFNAKDEKSMMLRFHTQTAGSSLTAQQPLNNITRTTVQALAATLGGTQSLHTNSFDEALGLPTEESAEIALRTQQIIACESGVASSVDPLAGSFLIESLTDKIEEEAFKRIEHIDSLGGMVAAIEAGYPQSEIETAAYHYQKAIEDKEQIIVGVNDFRSIKEKETKILAMNPKGEVDQIERLQAYKKQRDKKISSEALKKLKNAVSKNDNLVYPIVDAVRDACTLGEISDVLRQEFGEHKENSAF